MWFASSPPGWTVLPAIARIASAGMGWRNVSLLTVLVLLPGKVLGSDLPSPQLEFFEQQIRPVLANACYDCHGVNKQKGGLRVDSREGLLKGGDTGPAIIPGDAGNSLLIQSIRHEHPDQKMPKGRPKLANAVSAHFVKWVNEGALDPRDHPPKPDEVVKADWAGLFEARRGWWSFQAPRLPSVPAVTGTAWSEQPVDRFILAKLEEHGLAPAPAASAPVWLRRVHFAITGLPPTPGEQAAFLADPSPEGKAKVVDGLLASPHYGERWARHWMDLVRFAESYGHEQDFAIPYVWQYRDYLIRAFNADVPYTEFVKEHIAGDLLTAPRRHPDAGFNESVIGTGWWYLHQATHGPVDPYQDEADRMDNQVDVLSKTFLGLTVACSRCHDHKFDPIATKDYYSLTAFLRGSRQDLAYLDPNGQLEKRAEQLRQLHAEQTAVLRTALKDERARGGPEIAAYFMAAHEVIHGRAGPPDEEQDGPAETIFEDFEAGSYQRWNVAGDAFGTVPATGAHPGQQPVEGFLGTGLVNSFTRGDAPKGTLRSRSFQIGRPYIRLLVGGGIPSQTARVVLRVGDKEVRSAAGSNREQLEPVVWDVRGFAGQQASIEIIDDESNTWGHILVDQIVFTDSPDAKPARFTRPVAVVAAERGLKASVLERWATAWLSPAGQGPAHPLQVWLRAVAPENATPLPASSLAPPAPEPNAPAIPFPAPDYAGWFPSGQAFSRQAELGGNWRVAGAQIEFLPGTAAHSGLVAGALQGTLRSPTFTLTHPNIHLRLAGRGQVRLIISRYGLREFNPLLFEKTLFEVNTDGRFTWYSIDANLERHIGRLAYLEIIDNGKDHIAIDRIVFSTDPKPPKDIRMDGPAQGSPAQCAQHLESTVHKALDAWLDQKPGQDGLPLLAWLSQNGFLDWGAATPAIAGIAGRMEQAAEGLPDPMRVLAMTDGTVEPARVFVRGDHKNPGPPVERQFLQVLGGTAPLAIKHGSGRVELAEALIAHSNPLLHRVIVNRIWAHLFGRGLVPTVDNFGKMSRPPSHPELLDYLALHFRDGGGSIKKLIRSLCLTQTYAMSSNLSDPVAETRDPENALLHRMKFQRLEGEAIRDSLLAVQGQWNRTQFGPSVPTYFTPFMGDRMWVKNESGPMDGDRRRSVYLETRRNFLNPWMLTFDLPVPDTTVGQRNCSNVPGQALTLMNDPFVKLQAETWAKEWVGRTDLSGRQRIELMFVCALARQPKPAEMDQMINFLQVQVQARGLPAEAVQGDQALWADACHVIFMMKEFCYVQ
jgi:hypothetical protein